MLRKKNIFLPALFCLLVHFPIWGISQHAIILTDASKNGIPTPCLLDMNNHSSQVIAGNDPAYCYLTPLIPEDKVAVNEVFYFDFCNHEYEVLWIKVRAIDDDGSTVFFNLGPSIPPMSELLFVVNVVNPEVSIPSQFIHVNVGLNHTEVSLDLPYNLILNDPQHTEFIRTTYEVSEFISGNGLTHIRDASSVVPFCAGANNNPNNFRSEPQEKLSVVLSPNPATDILHVHAKDIHATSVRIIDMMGRSYEVTNSHISTTNQLSLSIAELNSGVYLLQVQTQNGWITRKWMKE